MYAGLQNGKDCSCMLAGYDYFGEGRECDIPCEGAQEDMCGGRSDMLVYAIITGQCLVNQGRNITHCAEY